MCATARPEPTPLERLSAGHWEGAWVGGGGKSGAGGPEAPAPEADLLEAAQHAALPQWAREQAAPAGARFAGALPNREEISLSSSSSSSSSSSESEGGAGDGADSGGGREGAVSPPAEGVDGAGPRPGADAGARLDALIRSEGWEALEGGDEEGGGGEARGEPEVPGVDAVDAAVVAVAELSLAGTVMSVVEGTVVVAGTEGRAAFDNGSVLCLEDRTVLGRVTDVFGPIESPFYSVQGTSEVPAAVQAGAPVMAVAGHSERLLPDAVRAQEGAEGRSGADEGSGGEEEWFSDDEAEQQAQPQAGKAQGAVREGGTAGRGKGRGGRKGRRGGRPKPAHIAPYPGMPAAPGPGMPLQAPPLPGAAPSPYGAWAGYAPPPPPGGPRRS